MHQKLRLIFFTLLGILGIHGNAFAGDDEVKDLGMLPGDFSISVGAGKNKFFHDEFELVAPYMANLSLDYVLFKNFELGIEYAPVFFSDRNTVNFVNTAPNVDRNFGGMQCIGGNLKYGIYNDYGVLAYLSAGGKYSLLDRNQYTEGNFREIDGEGYYFSGGIGVRYQLGNEHGDVFPWFFEMSVLYTRSQFKVTEYRFNEEVQPKTSSGWNDLDFNGIDVIIRFGYRFRKKN